MKNYQKWIIASLVAVLAVFYRVEWTIENFSPILGLGLVLGYFLGMRYGLTAILLSMVSSDIIMAMNQTWTTFWGYMSFQPVIYGTYALILGLSYFLFKSNIGKAASPIVSSVTFFLITNFVVWLDIYGWGMYTRDVAGLVSCFTMAIPFYRGTFLSDLVVTYSAFAIGWAVQVFVKHNMPLTSEA